MLYLGDKNYGTLKQSFFLFYENSNGAENICEVEIIPQDFKVKNNEIKLEERSYDPVTIFRINKKSNPEIFRKYKEKYGELLNIN